MPKDNFVCRRLGFLAVLILPAWGVPLAPVHARATVSLASVHMVTSTTGWAAGGARLRAILRTNDGGRNWTDVLSVGSALTAAAFLDARSARVATIRSYGSRTIRIYRTEDAGAHWTQAAISVPAMSTGSVLQLDFPTRRQGWLLAGVTPGMGHLIYTLWHSSDGGAGWTEVAYDLESRISRGAFPGCNCLGGNNTGITILADGTGWVTGEPFATAPPSIYVTHDAGRTWRTQSLPRTSGRVVQVTHTPVFLEAGNGYLPSELDPPGAPRVSVNAYVTHDGGRSWKPTSTVYGQEPIGTYARGPAYSFVAGGQGWMAVPGYFWHTADGGSHWERLHPAGWPIAASQIQFLNRELGFALPAGPASGYLLRTQDGGRSWQRIPTHSGAQQVAPSTSGISPSPST